MDAGWETTAGLQGLVLSVHENLLDDKSIKALFVCCGQMSKLRSILGSNFLI